MKRSRMPDRTGEIARTSPLRRISRLRSSGPVKAKRRDTGPHETIRMLVRLRSDDRCEACGHFRSDGIPMDIHHRRPRALGGSSDPATNLPSNLVLLDRQCHRLFESHRTKALDTGWLVLQGHDPSLVPLTLWSGREVLLSDDGRYVDYQDQQKGA